MAANSARGVASFSAGMVMAGCSACGAARRARRRFSVTVKMDLKIASVIEPTG